MKNILLTVALATTILASLIPSAAIAQTSSSSKPLGSETIKASDGSTAYFDRWLRSNGKHALQMTYSTAGKPTAEGKKTQEVLMGYIRAICNDRNYMIYETVDPKAPVQGTFLCTINREYADYIRRYASTNEGKDNIAKGSYKELVETFGAAEVNKAKPISKEVNCTYIDNNHITYHKPGDF